MTLVEWITTRYGDKVVDKTKTEKASPCPICGGEDRFCVFVDKDRGWCRKCGAKLDLVDLLVKVDNVPMDEALKTAGIERVKGKAPDGAGPKKKFYSQKDICALLETDGQKPAAIYEYLDQNGRVVSYVVRIEHPNKGKTFRQLGPFGEKTVKDLAKVLYNLPAVIEADEIYFVEGEKDVETLRDLGLVGSTILGGAANVDNMAEKGVFQPLTGKIVYIFPDNDKPGEKMAEAAAKHISAYTDHVHVVTYPSAMRLPAKGDVTDIANRYGDKSKAREKIQDLARTAPRWSSFYTATELLEMSFETKPDIIGDAIFPFGSHILVAGEAGVGKSLLRLDMALHLALGQDWLGHKVEKPWKVLIIQYENTEKTERSRLYSMAWGMGVKDYSKIPIMFLKRNIRFDLTTKGDREILKKIVAESGAEVVIYDCLSNIHEGDENKSRYIRPVLDHLVDANAGAGCACLVIHHFGKPNEFYSDRDRIRGASAIMDWAVTAMTYTNIYGQSERTFRKLDFVKMREGNKLAPVYLERDTRLMVKPVEAKDIFGGDLIVDIIKNRLEFDPTRQELERVARDLFKLQPYEVKNAIENALLTGQISESTIPGRGKVIVVNHGRGVNRTILEKNDDLPF